MRDVGCDEFNCIFCVRAECLCISKAGDDLFFLFFLLRKGIKHSWKVYVVEQFDEQLFNRLLSSMATASFGLAFAQRFLLLTCGGT